LDSRRHELERDSVRIFEVQMMTERTLRNAGVTDAFIFQLALPVLQLLRTADVEGDMVEAPRSRRLGKVAERVILSSERISVSIAMVHHRLLHQLWSRVNRRLSVSVLVQYVGDILVCQRIARRSDVSMS
jgi:hypothetical protein